MKPSLDEIVYCIYSISRVLIDACLVYTLGSHLLIVELDAWSCLEAGVLIEPDNAPSGCKGHVYI